MAKLSILAGTTSKLIDVFIQDSSVTTGAGLAALAFGTSGLIGYYYREGAASAVAITLATMTLGTWATGGFIVVDGTHMVGLYQLGIPNAALAAGAKSVVVMFSGATNMAPMILEIELTAVDNQSTGFGLVNASANIAQINANATAAATLATSLNSVATGTIGTGSSTTNIVTSAFTPAGIATDQFKGRVLIFTDTTTTTALRGQATNITGSTISATPTLTVTALTTAAVSGDQFIVV